MSNPLRQLQAAGQSIWLDYIRRRLITSGDLARLVHDDGLRGVTINPTLFEKAVAGSSDYDDAIRKLLAVEYQEFGECMLTGKAPEVGAYVGRKALALVNAALESSVLNRPVTLEEIEAERTNVYESEINAYWKI